MDPSTMLRQKKTATLYTGTSSKKGRLTLLAQSVTALAHLRILTAILCCQGIFYSVFSILN